MTKRWSFCLVINNLKYFLMCPILWVASSCTSAVPIKMGKYNVFSLFQGFPECLIFFNAKQLPTIKTSVRIHVIFLSLLSSIVHRVSFSEFVQHHIHNNNIYKAFTKKNHKNAKNTVKLARYYKFKEFKQKEFNFGEPCSVQSTNVLH